jgi:hypothetical protein
LKVIDSNAVNMPSFSWCGLSCIPVWF